VRRNGKFGGFLGCSRYPNCKNTEQLDYKGPLWTKGAGSGLPSAAATGGDGRSPPARASAVGAFMRSSAAAGSGIPTPSSAAASPAVAAGGTGGRIHGFGSGFGPGSGGAKPSLRTPFHGGEARGPTDRPPCPLPPPRKRRIVNGCVMADEALPGALSTPQDTPAAHTAGPAPVTLPATTMERRGGGGGGGGSGSVCAAAAVSAVGAAGTAASARDSARDAALARVAAATPSPSCSLVAAAKKKRRSEAVAAVTATAAVAGAYGRQGDDAEVRSGWDRFAVSKLSAVVGKPLVAPLLRAALRAIKHEHADKKDAAFRALLTYITNVVNNPRNPQFRRINKGNKAFVARVASCGAHGLRVLALAGFGDNGRPEYLPVGKPPDDFLVCQCGVGEDFKTQCLPRLRAAQVELTKSIENPFWL
jgi:hypothetical protein